MPFMVCETRSKGPIVMLFPFQPAAPYPRGPDMDRGEGDEDRGARANSSSRSMHSSAKASTARSGRAVKIWTHKRWVSISGVRASTQADLFTLVARINSPRICSPIQVKSVDGMRRRRVFDRAYSEQPVFGNGSCDVVWCLEWILQGRGVNQPQHHPGNHNQTDTHLNAQPVSVPSVLVEATDVDLT
jgi:hypothetical protein